MHGLAAPGNISTVEKDNRVLLMICDQPASQDKDEDFVNRIVNGFCLIIKRLGKSRGLFCFADELSGLGINHGMNQFWATYPVTYYIIIFSFLFF